MTDYVVLDIETTGLEAGKHRITEIAALKIKDGKASESFSYLIRPYRRLDFEYLPREITDLTGITMDMIKNGQHIEEALDELRAFVGQSTVLGHNLKRFDMGFLQADYNYFKKEPLENELVDSMELARKVLKQKNGNGLQKLAKKLGVSNAEPAHRALADCRVTHEVYMKLRQLEAVQT